MLELSVKMYISLQQYLLKQNYTLQPSPNRQQPLTTLYRQVQTISYAWIFWCNQYYVIEWLYREYNAQQRWHNLPLASACIFIIDTVLVKPPLATTLYYPFSPCCINILLIQAKAHAAVIRILPCLCITPKIFWNSWWLRRITWTAMLSPR